MHTVFINTSKRTFDHYRDVLELAQETRELIPFDCPFAEWQKGGYVQCAARIGEMIDSYKNIYNDYNLIIYVDLLEFDAYTRDVVDEKEENILAIRAAARVAIHKCLTHYFYKTIYQELDDHGRKPNEAVIVFEESEKLSGSSEPNYLEANEKDILLSFLGLPCKKELGEIVKSLKSEERGAVMAAFHASEAGKAAAPLLLGLDAMYEQKIALMFETLKTDSIDKAVEQLYTDIVKLFKSEQEGMKCTTFLTKRRAGETNKRESARSAFTLYLYLLERVRRGALFVRAMDKDETVVKDGNPVFVAATIPPMTESAWKTVVNALQRKQQAFGREYKKARRFFEQERDNDELVPPMYKPDFARLGVDMYGNRNEEWVVAEAAVEKKDEETSGTISDDAVCELVVAADERQSLFTRAEYPPFDPVSVPIREPDARTSPEQYVAYAKQLHKDHMQYYYRLQEHVTNRLASYAGQSKKMKLPLLKKRPVDVEFSKEEYDESLDYRYAQKEKDKDRKEKKIKDEQNLEVIKQRAENAYKTAKKEYLAFCAGRSLAVSDMEEQCNWFITRVGQIKKSLQRLGQIAIGFLIALLLLYIPFFAIQWNAITENIISASIAAVSVCVPLLLLYVVFAAIGARQRKKYAEAWQELCQRSNAAWEENNLAVEKYDRLLTFFLPALRWLYEYKLDVDFCDECCMMAKAKISHHVQKLFERKQTVGNILEDFECRLDEIEDRQEDDTKRVNCNVSYSDEENCSFYAIVDNELLDAIYGKGDSE